jgi:hypothetical protein
MSGPGKIDFDSLKPEDFERHLPDLFAGTDGKVSDDPRLKNLFAKYPDCLALVRDLETIAETARGLLEPVEDPSDQVWTNIQNKLLEENGSLGLDGEDRSAQHGPHPNGGLLKN